MKVSVVGATGLVGREMLKVLEERKFPVSEFIPVASQYSVDRTVSFQRKDYKIISAEEAIRRKPDIAIFSAGANTSLELAPLFAKAGTFVIDNSSAWRMNDEVPLVVPEINGHVLTGNEKIIANPNCSTIQLVLALTPLHRKFVIKRVVVSTYQSVSGSGAKAVNQMMKEREGKAVEKFYPHQIDMNVIPHGGNFSDDAYTTEEIKLVNETHKILDPAIRLTATVVRVPVLTGHSESVNIEFEHDFELYDIKRLLGVMPGIVVFDIPEGNIYPMPIFSMGKDDVFVGRIRRDLSQPRSLNLWIVADNLRKGAATNAIQIAEYILKNKLNTNPIH
jgi:aspartate-semialdehyde dehydrogenase